MYANQQEQVLGVLVKTRMPFMAFSITASASFPAGTSSVELCNIFCDSGPPHILHSNNGREFSNNLLLSTLAEKWPPLKVVHGKPRHPKSQGAVERANRYIKDALFNDV